MPVHSPLTPAGEMNRHLDEDERQTLVSLLEKLSKGLKADAGGR